MIQFSRVLLWCVALTGVGCTLVQPRQPVDLSTRTDAVGCTVSTLPVTLDPATSFDTVKGTLLVYLNDGGKAELLNDELRAMGLLLDEAPPDRDPLQAPIGGGIWVADLNADNTLDIVVNVHQVTQNTTGESFVRSRLFTLLCLADSSSFWEGHEINFESPPLIPQDLAGLRVGYVADLNQDERTEIIAHTTECGAHTCFTNIRVYTMQGLDLVPVVADVPLSYPAAGYVVEDGLVKVRVGLIGSAGAGPQRRREVTYRWDNGTLAYVSDISMQPPEYKFQAAWDGMQAINSGDFDTALTLFDRALNDTSLQDASQIFAAGNPRPGVVRDSFATYGILLATLGKQDRTAQEIITAYENVRALPQNPIFQDQLLSENLWRRYGILFFETAQQQDLATACDAVIADINATARNPEVPQLFVAEYWGDFGYANLAPEPEFVCPY